MQPLRLQTCALWVLLAAAAASCRPIGNVGDLPGDLINVANPAPKQKPAPKPKPTGKAPNGKQRGQANQGGGGGGGGAGFNVDPVMQASTSGAQFRYSFAAVENVQQAQALSADLKRQISTPEGLAVVYRAWYDAYQPDFALGSAEYEDAQTNFKVNMEVIADLNSSPDMTWVAGANRYTYLSDAQLRDRMLLKQEPKDAFPPGANDTSTEGYGISPPTELLHQLLGPQRTLPGNLSAVAGGMIPTRSGRRLAGLFYPDDIDWRYSGKVTSVKDQGPCSSCWAFATTAGVESAYLIGNGPWGCGELDLSEQQLVDCVRGGSQGYDSKGCDGGYIDEAADYTYRYNQVLERYYPYTATSNACSASRIASAPPGQYISLAYNYKRIWPSKVGQLLQYYTASRPIMIAFMVDSEFRHYRGGIFIPKTCSSSVNHAMLLIGYHTSGSGTDYWVIKNSWGRSWGSGGYMYLKMSFGWPLFDNGPCGMYRYAYMVSTQEDAGLAAACPPPPRPPPAPCVGVRCYVNWGVVNAGELVVAQDQDQSPPPPPLIILREINGISGITKG